MAKKLTALIDADILIYQAAATAEHAVNWGEGIWSLYALESDAIRNLTETYNRIMEATGATDSIMCISAPSSEGWRMKVLPTYKGNRKDTRPPMLREFMKQYVRENFKTNEKPTLEGDDLLGIYMTHSGVLAGDKICCTIDKDLKTVVGNHYNFKKDEFFTVTQEQADLYHMQQTLSGDPTDGYSGCPDVGTQTALEFLESGQKLVPVERVLKSGVNKGQTRIQWERVPANNLWEIVVSLYAKAGLGEEEALRQARVARICRAEDYDFKNKEVILWNPPKTA